MNVCALVCTHTFVRAWEIQIFYNVKQEYYVGTEYVFICLNDRSSILLKIIIERVLLFVCKMVSRQTMHVYL